MDGPLRSSSTRLGVKENSRPMQKLVRKRHHPDDTHADSSTGHAAARRSTLVSGFGKQRGSKATNSLATLIKTNQPAGDPQGAGLGETGENSKKIDKSSLPDGSWLRQSVGIDGDEEIFMEDFVNVKINDETFSGFGEAGKEDETEGLSCWQGLWNSPTKQLRKLVRKVPGFWPGRTSGAEATTGESNRFNPRRIQLKEKKKGLKKGPKKHREVRKAVEKLQTSSTGLKEFEDQFPVRLFKGAQGLENSFGARTFGEDK